MESTSPAIRSRFASGSPNDGRRRRALLLIAQLRRTDSIRGCALVNCLREVLREIALGTAPACGIRAAQLDNAVSAALVLAISIERKPEMEPQLKPWIDGWARVATEILDRHVG